MGRVAPSIFHLMMVGYKSTLDARRADFSRLLTPSLRALACACECCIGTCITQWCWRRRERRGSEWSEERVRSGATMICRARERSRRPTAAARRASNTAACGHMSMTALSFG